VLVALRFSVLRFISDLLSCPPGGFSRCGVNVPLVALVADRATGGSDDVRDGCVGVGLRVMSLAWQRIGDVDRRAVEQAQQLGVETCGGVLAVP
jgi:hypothetical protein